MALFTRLLLHGLLPIVLLGSGYVITGCGYKLRADGEPLGITIKSFSIPLMTSTSSNLGFEADFTRIVREEFVSRSNVRLVSKERAEMVLIGRVYDIKTEPLTYDHRQQSVGGHLTTFEVTNSRRLKIRLDVKLTERATGRVVWHDDSMEDKAAFLVSADPLENRFNQSRAVEKIARSLAKRIFLKTVERF